MIQLYHPLIDLPGDQELKIPGQQCHQLGQLLCRLHSRLRQLQALFQLPVPTLQQQLLLPLLLQLLQRRQQLQRLLQLRERLRQHPQQHPQQQLRQQLRQLPRLQRRLQQQQLRPLQRVLIREAPRELVLLQLSSAR